MTRSRSASATSSRPQNVKRMIGRIGVGLTALCVVAMAAGCASEDADKALMRIAPDWDSFEREVLKSPRPVLVEFSKDPCPPCVSQKAELATLTDEFRGQVTFATFLLVQGDFHVNCQKIQERYQLHWMPTTILIVNGKERMRWEDFHKAAGIREGLKQALLETPSSP
jgi:thioredoxin-like negative regulator of GroEL